MSNDDLTRTNLVVDNTKLSPTLQCPICLDLVMDPVECENCRKLFCKECINSWLKNSSECPNKHLFEKQSTLDDWIKPALDRIFIKCPFQNCNNSYAYTTWKNHVNRCASKSKGYKTLSTENTTPTGDEIFEFKEVQFFVKLINNQNLVFVLPLSTTVKELKEKLKEKSGFKVSEQRLSCNGKNMDDERMLEFYGVQQNTTIVQLARLKGGNEIYD